ncbi:Protein wntless-like protein [Trichoplax sp. H2]|nr:Protein wntless-like protein [Trichoplax sp. H2]|eukprot:RDD46188.1 Protein wntless-like protein [Trichoplax sp. H2]
MSSIILETLSSKHLIAFSLLMLAAQISFIFIGLKAPSPTKAYKFTATTCKAHDKGKLKQWYDPDQCQEIDIRNIPSNIPADEIVFTVRIPNGYPQISRWNQYLLVLMNVDVEYDKLRPNDSKSNISYNVRLGYTNNLKTSWSLIAKADETRPLHCSKLQSEADVSNYICDYITLFEIGSCHYQYYLINIKLPTHHGMNSKIGPISEITFVGILQQGAFTEIWLIIKSVATLFIIPIVIKFRISIYKNRQPQLFERMLYALGISAIIVDLPVEWLTLWFNMPQLLLLNDIRTGIFNMALFIFWAIFVGEHSLEQGKRNNLKTYWKQIIIIILSCLSLLIFDLCERGIQLSNPFYSIWATEGGRRIAVSLNISSCNIIKNNKIYLHRKLVINILYGFIIVAAICICLYLVSIVAMVIRVLRGMQTRQGALPHMQQSRRMFYEGLIYRFRFQLLFSVICAVLTVAFVIINSLSHFKEESLDEDEQSDLQIASAFLTGIYGLWNIYTFTVIFLYCPSNKVDGQNDQELTTLNEDQHSVIYRESGKESYH